MGYCQYSAGFQCFVFFSWHVRFWNLKVFGAILLCGGANDIVATPTDSPGSSSLKTLTSLNKEVRPFLLSDNSIWSYPSVSSLSDYSISRS